MEALIDVKGVSKFYRKDKGFREMISNPFGHEAVKALDKVDLEVKPGQLFGLLGPNGAGKTTLMKIMGCLLLPDEGRVTISGLDIEQKELEVKQKACFINNAERSFFWRLTGRENLKFFGRLNGLKGRALAERIDWSLDLVGLTQKGNHRFDSYSAGMKRRLSIARSFLGDPEIFLMDEPTIGIDPIVAKNLKAFIKEKMVKELGKTVVYTTQYLGEAEELCDETAILVNGRIKAVGRFDDLEKTFHQLASEGGEEDA
jgi:ABC-2 type transport system ATP-binding protein